ncbi:14762_t:CDS:2 [Funneliformis geosporum]|uniref:14762_t:CDS:1 n=1 Tax=Funneliformis geosporum TaxID=1117311 RepID=A0A9W4WZQ8_9GLOM|nr:14762_t:CDS:2 [Funneliformis geosporum]
MTKGKLLIEIEKGLEDRKITRLDLLKLVGIDYCLECRGYYYEERTAEVKLKEINNKELLSEVETRFKGGIINRRELLMLIGIKHCLGCGDNCEECEKNSPTIEENGYCQDCNMGGVLISSE